MRIVTRPSMCALFALAAAAAAARADELPSFQPGMWSYSVTINHYGDKQPKVRTMTRCADPGREIRDKWKSLEAQGCRFSEVTRTGNQYSYSTSCKSQGQVVTLKSVIQVDKEGAYRVDSESHTLTQASRELIVARRTGNCTD